MCRDAGAVGAVGSFKRGGMEGSWFEGIVGEFLHENTFSDEFVSEVRGDDNRCCVDG